MTLSYAEVIEIIKQLWDTEHENTSISNSDTQKISQLMFIVGAMGITEKNGFYGAVYRKYKKWAKNR